MRRWLRARTTASATTHGLTGRLAWTLLVFLPLYVMWKLNNPYEQTILGLAVYPYLMWRFLRAIWAPVRLPPDPDQPDTSGVPGLLEPDVPSIAERQSPTRW